MISLSSPEARFCEVGFEPDWAICKVKHLILVVHEILICHPLFLRDGVLSYEHASSFNHHLLCQRYVTVTIPSIIYFQMPSVGDALKKLQKLVCGLLCNIISIAFLIAIPIAHIVVGKVLYPPHTWLTVRYYTHHTHGCM